MPCVCSVAVAARGIVPAGRRGSLPCGVFSSRGTALRRLGGPWYLFGGGRGRERTVSCAGLGSLPLGWGGDSPRLVERFRGLSRGLLASGSAGRAGGETRGERVTGLGQVRALGILALFGEGSRVRVAERAKVVMSRSGRWGAAGRAGWRKWARRRAVSQPDTAEEPWRCSCVWLTGTSLSAE